MSPRHYFAKKFITSSAKSVIHPKLVREVLNIAGRLPENRGSSFVDLQTQKDSKRNRTNKFDLLNAQRLHIDSESVKLIFASNSCSQINFN